MKASASNRTIVNDRYRHRQEHVLPGWVGRARGNRAASEAVTRPSLSSPREHAAVPSGQEVCVGAHHLSRQLLALGHDVK
jgi:hypothetical protein